MSDLKVLNPTIGRYDHLPLRQYFFIEDGYQVYLKTYVSLVRQEDFEKLRDAWLEQTQYYSDPEVVFCNENYRKIVDLGYRVLPNIINDLKHNQNDWFFALHEITRENPVKEENAGKATEMTKDWLEWSKTNLGI